MLREDLELHLSDAISLMSADRKLCGSPSCRQCLVYTALETSNILKRAMTCAIANTKSFLQVLRYFMIFCAVSSSKVTFTELGRKKPWGREMADDDNGTCALTKVWRIGYFTAWNIVNLPLKTQKGNDSDPFHLGNTYGGLPTNLVRVGAWNDNNG